MNDILIIIPNLNNLKVLKKCLNCLTYEDTNCFDVLIVDNGSDDDTINFINDWTKEDERNHAIYFDTNCGFAKACNRGIIYSIENEYKYSILLNNDAFVEKKFVSSLVKKIESDDKLFAVSSLMLSFKNRHVIDSFGDNYSMIGYAYQNKVGQDEKEIDEDINCFSACGGASIYDNEKLKEVGLFDEKFFAYLEDVDLSYRARLKGYKICTCKNARCYHLGSNTSGSKYNNFKVRISSRNNIFLIYKNMSNIQIAINAIPIFFGTLLKLLFFVRLGFAPAYIMGIKDAFNKLDMVERQDFKKISPLNLIMIEIELINNTFTYISDFLKRKSV